MKTEYTLEEFLAPISKGLGREAVPETIEPCAALNALPRRVHVGTHTELVNTFVGAAEAMRVTVHRCKPNEVGTTVASIISAGEAQKTVTAHDGRIQSLGIAAALENANVDFSVWDPQAGAEACRAQCVDAAFGITFPTFAVAETGSMVQLCDENCGRSISLLPETHIAIIAASDIVPQMADALAQMKQTGGETGANLPSQICFISGPSNTSDIELVRVEGVHGPMYVHYVVIGS